MPPLTEYELNAVGGQSMMDGALRTAAPPNISTTPTINWNSTPSTTASSVSNNTSPTPEPTIGETLAGIKTKALGIQDILNQRATAEGSLATPTYDTGPTYKELYPDINEKDIQRQQMRLFQKEIDATNRVYQDMLNQERLAGQGRLGTQTAMAARGGLLGSDFGEAQRQTQLGANAQAERAIQNERIAKIGTIMGTMRKAVADEITAKRLARQQDAQSYIDYLAGAKSRREGNLKLAATALLDAGLDPLTMDPSELDAIGKEAGLSANDIIAQYRQSKKEQEAAAAESDLKTRKTEAEINKIEADIAKGKLIEIGEGTMLYNTETGETFKNPKTYAPGTGGLGSFSSESVTEAAQALDSTRGADNYANTGVYLDLYDQAVSGGVLPQDFFKKFPPDLYLNPEDNSVPGYVKQQMQEVDLFNSL